nr:unnamed protein product [Callosobruchus chinensis]
MGRREAICLLFCAFATTAAAAGFFFHGKNEPRHNESLNVGLILPHTSFGVREYIKAINNAVAVLHKQKGMVRAPTWLRKYNFGTKNVHYFLMTLTPSPTADLGYENDSDSESDPFSTDEDSDYVPDNLHDQGISNSTPNQDVSQVPGKRKRTRRRVRNVKEWKRVKAKTARLSGDAYKTAKGKETQKKQYNCNNISEQERQTIFKKFYQLGNYDLQSNFIASCIKKNNPCRVKADALAKKNYVTIITLLNLRVCKQFFLNTLSISNKRFTTVCQKISAEGFVQTDQRGKHTPSNKIDNMRRCEVIEHIQKFPRYRSHYSISKP